MLFPFLLGCTGGHGETNPTDTADTAATPDDAGDTGDSGDTGADCDATVPTIALPDFTAAAPYTYQTVSPSAIDPETDVNADYEHQVFYPDTPTRAELLVYLPGTDGKPANGLHLLDIAARSGYRAIGLAYPTDENTGDICPAWDDDEACTEAFNREKLYGVDGIEELDIDEADSIVGRLTRLLAALDSYAPGAGFGDYLDGGTVQWERVIVVGWSQGSSITGFLGRDVELAGSVHLAAGCNTVEEDGAAAPAAWCLEPRATPLDRMFSLIHTLDDWEYDSLVSWEVYDLDAWGGSADAGTLAPDYCTGPHLLTTSLSSQGGGAEYHKSIATDAQMPLDDDGVPVLAEDYVWLFTLGAG